MEKVSDIVLKQEMDFIRGSTRTSKYVTFSLYETLSRIDAYLNSTHISGSKDAKGRLKPFINIVITAANIWWRATDIDRQHIKLWAKKRKQWLKSFFINIVFQNWMKKEDFGIFLNEWGRTLSRYGSALIKFVENSSGLHISVIPWNTLIIDSVNINAAPIIEVIELSESQLQERIETHGYDAKAVENLLEAKRMRETIDKQRKDTKSNYYKLYEVHGKFAESEITGKDKDTKIIQQMHVISFVGGKKDGMNDTKEFTLFKGKEDDPYELTHLIKEDNRVIGIGPVEYLFDAQWMQNHAVKSTKDHLDIASKLLLQTADPNFLGRNINDQLESGDILVYGLNKPLTKVDNISHDIVSWQNYAIQFKEAGRELVGISEAMLGTQPKAGTAWRLQETVLAESYSLFELMTENKGLDLARIIRKRILPYLLKKYNTNEEISTILEQNDLDKIDRIFIKNESIRRVNEKIFSNLEALAQGQEGQLIGPMEQSQMLQTEEQAIKSGLQQLSNQRFFAPSEVNWKKQFEGDEWDIEIDIGSEGHNFADMLATLNSALKIVTLPGFDQNPKAQAIVGRILELTNAMSPVEYNSLPEAALPSPVPGRVEEARSGGRGRKQRNIQS